MKELGITMGDRTRLRRRSTIVKEAGGSEYVELQRKKETDSEYVELQLKKKDSDPYNHEPQQTNHETTAK